MQIYDSCLSLLAIVLLVLLRIYCYFCWHIYIIFICYCYLDVNLMKLVIIRKIMWFNGISLWVSFLFAMNSWLVLDVCLIILFVAMGFSFYTLIGCSLCIVCCAIIFFVSCFNYHYLQIYLQTNFSPSHSFFLAQYDTPTTTSFSK